MNESDHTAGILQYHEPESWRFYHYGQDQDGEPLFSFWMNINAGTGICIYDRNGGAGKWLSTCHDDEEYSGVAPSDELKELIASAIGEGPGIRADLVEALPDYEEYFFRVIHGTVEQKGKAPDELLRFIEHCVGEEVHLRVE